jgi:hypothetical protein
LLPFERAVAWYAVDARDGIQQGDDTQTPSQFVYQAADCRIWYTAEMTVDVTAMWEKVVDVAWGGDKCVEGAVGLGERGVKARKAPLQRTGVDAEALAAAMDAWTDLRGQRITGDAYMMPE